MIKDIIFNRNVLSIYLENKVNKRNIHILRKRLYYIINEYGVSNIVIHLNNITYMDTEAFYDFLDEYDDEFGGHLKLEKGEKIL